MKQFRYLKNVTTLELSPEGCAGCGRCVDVCPHQVFELAGKQARIVTAMPAWSAEPAPGTALLRSLTLTPGSAAPPGYQ